MNRQFQDVTEAELALLQSLWDEGPATIRQLVDRVYKQTGNSVYATVQKLLDRLESKGFVRRDRGRPVHVFDAAINRDDLIGRRLRAVADSLCQTSKGRPGWRRGLQGLMLPFRQLPSTIPTSALRVTEPPGQPRATVAVSMFSEAVTATQPGNLLIVTGQWETFLRNEALHKLRLAEPSAAEGSTAGEPARGTGRRAVVAPLVEHVGVLYSPTALEEARNWLDSAFERQSAARVAASGGPIVLLLFGIVLLAWPLSQLLPKGNVITVVHIL